jgi:hypothetical protein
MKTEELNTFRQLYRYRFVGSEIFRCDAHGLDGERLIRLLTSATEAHSPDRELERVLSSCDLSRRPYLSGLEAYGKDLSGG